MKITGTDTRKKAVVLFLSLYVIFSIVSFLFTIFTNNYNGDFLLQRCTLSSGVLIFNLILTILPYYVVYYIYNFFRRKYKPKYCVPVASNTIEFVTIIINVVYLYLVWRYNVGKAFAEVYSAPPIITLIIQVILRLSPTLWLTFSFFISTKKARTTLYALLLILSGILTGFFSIFLFVIFMTILKYNAFWIPFIKRKAIIIVLIIIASAPLMEIGYTIRDSIRGVESNVSNLDQSTLLIGKFFGRLSPFPNTSMILQREKIYKIEAKKLPAYFFANSMLGIIHSSFKEDFPPEKILSGSKSDDYVSFMCGTTGILYFAAYNSIFSFLLTVVLILIVDFTVFKILAMFRFNLNYELSFYLLLSPTMSGVGKEYFAQLWGLIMILLICLLLNPHGEILKWRICK